MAKTNPPLNEPPDFQASLTPRRRQIFRTLQDLLAQPSHRLEWHRQVGSQVIQWRTLPDEKPVSFEKVALALGSSTSRLYKDRQFAEEYPREADVQKLEAQGYNWGFITAVLSVPSKSREKLLQEALTKGWNQDELEAEVKKRRGANHAGGRPLRAPATPELGVQQLAVLSGKWLRYFNEVWAGGTNPVTKQLAHLPAQSASHSMQKSLKDAMATVEQMDKAIASVRQFLKTLGRKAQPQRR